MGKRSQKKKRPVEVPTAKMSPGTIGQVKGAMPEFQKALAINPNYTDAHYNLGIALKQTGEVREAMAQFQEVLRLNPNDRGAQDNLAKIRAMLGQAPVFK